MKSVLHSIIALFIALPVISNAQSSAYSFYIDYSVANADNHSLLFQTPGNTSYQLGDTWKYMKIMQVFDGDNLAGYEEPTGTVQNFKKGFYYKIDSLFIDVAHENNSGLNDTILLYAIYADNDNQPRNYILWDTVLYANSSLSPSGNWNSGNNIKTLALPCKFNITLYDRLVGVVVGYKGAATDTFAIKGSGFTDNITGNTLASNYPYSVIRKTDLSGWFTTADSALGTPPGTDGYLPYQNWNLRLHANMVDTPDNIESPICYVTIDTTNTYWNIVWKKGPSSAIANYLIETEYLQGWWPEVIHTQPYTDFSSYTYIDPYTTHNSGLQNSAFKITATAENGDTLYASPIHKPIMAFSGDSLTHAYVHFTNYIGLNFPQYYIYRGTNANNLALYDSIAYPVNDTWVFYLDPEANSFGQYIYQIQAVTDNDCMPSMPQQGNNGSEKSGNAMGPRSNIVSTLPNAVSYNKLSDITLYPNPAQTTLNINLGKATGNDISIQVLSATGQLVYSTSKNGVSILPLDISALPTGLYLVQLQTSNLIKLIRFVKN